MHACARSHLLVAVDGGGDGGGEAVVDVRGLLHPQNELAILGSEGVVRAGRRREKASEKVRGGEREGERRRGKAREGLGLEGR